MSHLNCPTKSVAWLLVGALITAGCGKDDDDGEGENAPPVAEAGGPQLLSSNSAVNLSGSGSFDPDGDPLSFHWAIDSAPDESGLPSADSPFTVNDDRDPTTTFTPDAEGTFVVSLVVMDGQGLESAPDRTTITVSSGDAPVAEAGDDTTGNVGETINVDGSESWDALGRDLTYTWSFAQVPVYSALEGLSADGSADASFVPDVSGMYLVALVVDNGLESSSPDTTVIRVQASDSDIPIANAGGDVEGDDCTNIVLDGSESYDPNGEPLTYAWDLEERPAGSAATVDSFDDQGEGVASFHPDVDGEYLVSLSVYDGVGWSVPDHITLTANERDYNSPTAVNPGLGQVYEGGEAICEPSGYSYICGQCDARNVPLGADAVINDPDGDTVDFEWTSLSGSASVTDSTALETRAILSGARPNAPDVCASTTYNFRLSAVDCTGQESSQVVTHTVNCCGYLAE
jgi:hypothetical protein